MSGRGVCRNVNCRDASCRPGRGRGMRRNASAPPPSFPMYCSSTLNFNAPLDDPSSSESQSQSTNQATSNQRSSDSSSSTSSSVSSGVDSVIPDRMRYPEIRDSDQASPEAEVVQTSDNTTQAQVQIQAQVQSGNNFVCTDPGCSNPNCGISQNSSRAPVCTHEGCNCEHSGPFSARNVMIGLTGLLMLLMVGYMAYMKRKPSRPKSNTFNGHIVENGMGMGASVPVFVEKSRF